MKNIYCISLKDGDNHYFNVKQAAIDWYKANNGDVEGFTIIDAAQTCHQLQLRAEMHEEVVGRLIRALRDLACSCPVELLRNTTEGRHACNALKAYDPIYGPDYDLEPIPFVEGESEIERLIRLEKQADVDE